MKFEFQNIVESNQEKVRNICFRYVHNIDDADDIAQDVFVKVYESLSHFREESELSTWIYKIAVNKSLDFIKAAKRKKRYGQILSIFGFGDNEEPLEIPTFNNPQKELETDERKEILYKVIDTLPENQKTALILSKIKGFSNKEIAKIMDMSLSAIEALHFRAKKSLDKKLKEYFEKVYK